MEATPCKVGESLPAAEFASYQRHAVERWHNGVPVDAIDQVAEEVPIAMVYNGISHAVMLATPASLEHFGLGFSLSEGLLRDRCELYELEIVHRSEGIELQMRIAQERFAELKQRRRNLAGRTGCGLCGVESLQQVLRHPDPVRSMQHFKPQVLHAALQRLPQKQSLQALTGAVHAAAWMTPDGAIALVEEDIGRHNALDKLIGAMAMNGADFGCGGAIVTSRASVEMAQKAAMAGIPLLVAVSAPTALAIRLAHETGLTLVGFARHGGHVVYANSQRLTGQ